MGNLSSLPVSVFLATARPEEAKKFYEGTLGLTFVEDNPYALVFLLKGIELRISKVSEFTPFQWTVLDWQVSDIETAVSDLVSSGVEFVRYDFLDQDENGIMTMTGEGVKIAWFKDPDGNTLSISQRS